MAKRTRHSFSEAAQDLLEEAVRLRECPGIYFADEPAGRVAKVSGTGLGVWEVINTYQGVRGSLRQLRRWHPHVSPAQLKAALLYYDQSGRFAFRGTTARSIPEARRLRRTEPRHGAHRQADPSPWPTQ